MNDIGQVPASHLRQKAYIIPLKSIYRYSLPVYVRLMHHIGLQLELSPAADK